MSIFMYVLELQFKLQRSNIIKQMDSQLSLENLNYFHQLQQKISSIKKQIKHMDTFSKERQKKYDACINAYEKYVKKQNEALTNNKRHCEQRNKFYLKQTQNSWKNTISNRQLVLRSLARTNVIKREADDWILRMEGQVMGYDDSQLGDNRMEESQLINKYNQILRQYNLK